MPTRETSWRPPLFPFQISSLFLTRLQSDWQLFFVAARPTSNLQKCRLFQIRRRTAENHIACQLVGYFGCERFPPKCHKTWGHTFELETRDARAERHLQNPPLFFQRADHLYLRGKLECQIILNIACVRVFSKPPAGKKSGDAPHVKQFVSWPLAVLIAFLLLLPIFTPTSSNIYAN